MCAHDDLSCTDALILSPLNPGEHMYTVSEAIAAWLVPTKGKGKMDGTFSEYFCRLYIVINRL